MPHDTIHETNAGSSRGPALFKRLALGVFGGLLLLLAALLFQAVWWGREAAISSASCTPLNQLQLAFCNYHGVYGCFPPAYVADEAGKPMHSWRALILPFIDGNELYRQYDFREPWNGPGNSRLAHRMPGIFCCPSEPGSDRYANYVVIVGPDTAFPGAKSTSIADFEDGLDHTILLAEIAGSKIEWLEPRDLDVATMSFTINDPAKPSISSSRRKGPYVVFADYIQTHRPRGLAPETLKALTTVRGHEPVFVAEGSGGLTSPLIGPATDADLARFADWPDVGRLWLNRSHITDAGLANLTRATKLSTLHLAHTSVTDAGLRHLKGRTFFYTLDLSSTNITDAGLVHLAGLVDMYYLDLRETRVTIAGVATLLRSLPKAKITFAAGMAGEQRLELHGSGITGTDLNDFRKSPDFQIIDLSRTAIDDAALGRLASWRGLRWLDVSHTRITDAGLEHLRQFGKLTDLNMTGTDVTEIGIAELQRSLPKLRVKR